MNLNCRNLVACLLLIILGSNPLLAQTNYNVANAADLATAISNAQNGDQININGDIVVNSEMSISNSITINGNNFSVSVPVPGLNDAGISNNNASTFRIWNISGTAKVTIKNLQIKGGNTAGSCIYNSTTSTVILDNVKLSNCRNSGSGGGAIQNYGNFYLMKCLVLRNSASYGGGFLNKGSMFIENSTFAENRSENVSGGGGAGENGSYASKLYINNSTFSNNKSTEIGGAINNKQGLVYVLNSTFSGNVAYGNYAGGAIGNNGGSVYALNSLFAYNYYRTSGTTSNPTGFSLNDFGLGNVNTYYCIVHSTTYQNKIIGGNVYTGLADGSDNTLFTGGSQTQITNGSGTVIGTGLVFQPFLVSTNGSSLPTLKTGSFALSPENSGCITGYSSNNGSPVIGYMNMSTRNWVNLINTNASSNQVMTDELYTVRKDPPTIGAVESAVDRMFMVKVLATSNGTVSGASIYGDVYPAGTTISVTALPNSGFQFVEWDYDVGGTASTGNPYTFILNDNITLVPVFVKSQTGTYSITYSGNGNSRGIPPGSLVQSGAAKISDKNDLQKTGYSFMGWNTLPSGAGTDYQPGSTYSGGSNLVLYAKWVRNYWLGNINTDGSNGLNWEAGVMPKYNESAVFHPSASNDLVLPADVQFYDVDFNQSGRKLVVGDYNLSVIAVRNANSDSYIKTTGTGKLHMSLNHNDSLLYPVGNQNFCPVTITNRNDAADEFAVAVKDKVLQGGIAGEEVKASHVQHTWDISKLNPDNFQGIDLTFTWGSNQIFGNLQKPALYHYGSNWDKQVGPTTFTETSLTYRGYAGTFSPFAIADVNFSSLPVSWLNFEGRRMDSRIVLSWSTGSEYNTQCYLIQRSLDLTTWKNIGKTSAAGYSSQILNYTYWDDSPSANLSYYRIIQQDTDGKQHFSKTIAISPNNRNQPGFQIFPNPVVNGWATVRIPNASLLQIFNSSGRLVFEKHYSSGEFQIFLGDFPKGIYFVKLDFGIISISIL